MMMMMTKASSTLFLLLLLLLLLVLVVPFIAEQQPKCCCCAFAFQTPVAYHPTTTATTKFGIHNNNNRLPLLTRTSSSALFVSLQPQQWSDLPGRRRGDSEEGNTKGSASPRKSRNKRKNIATAESPDKQQGQKRLLEKNQQTPPKFSNQIGSVVGALVVLTFVILFHELGHFLTAKSFGLQPQEFNIGFGPKLASVVGDTTSFNLRLVPLGGYVSLDRSRMSLLPYWAQIQILSAGVFFNLLLSWLIYTLQIWKGQQGIPVPVFDSGIVVGGLVESQGDKNRMSGPVPPAKGLLKPGDIIVGVNGKSIQEEPTSSEMEVQRAIDLLLKEVQSTPFSEEVIFTVVDPNGHTKVKNVHVVPRSNGTSNTKPSIGVYLLPNFAGMDTLKANSPLDASALAASYVSTNTKETMIGILTFGKDKLAGLAAVVVGRKNDEAASPPQYEVAGPVRVVERASNVVASHDFDTIMNYIAAASINLGMFNFVPIPPTDGFQILVTTIIQAASFLVHHT